MVASTFATDRHDLFEGQVCTSCWLIDISLLGIKPLFFKEAIGVVIHYVVYDGTKNTLRCRALLAGGLTLPPIWPSFLQCFRILVS